MKKNKFATRITGYGTGGLNVLIIRPRCSNSRCRSENLLKLYPDSDVFRCTECKKDTKILVKVEGVPIQKK